ncbi:MAG TPA: hypothetical protein VK023_00840 [Sphingobacterium bovisgrunnientis]|jgi:hypothetical protein|nr:hypothetical protein [Sphingobacterium bovisgrunnientis]
MNLGRQIYSLLKRHAMVFVKGLGTFKRIRTSASFDAKRKVVLPPLSYIEFEHEVQEGYDFALYIQQSQHLEKSEAETLIQREIEILIDSINTDGQATLEELGQLVSYGHSYIFKPFDLSGFQFLPIEDPYVKDVDELDNLAVNNEIDNTSVESFPEEISPISEKDKKILQEVHQIDNSSSVKAPAYTTNTPYAEHNNYFEDEKPRRNNTLVYVLIAALALITLGGIYYYSIITKKLDNVDQYLTEFGIDTIDQDGDTLSTVIDTNSITPIDSTTLLANDSLVTQLEEPAPKVVEPINHKFAIVVGTHPKFAQAEAEAAEYHKKGFKHVRALPSNLEKNRKKVIWDTYPTKELRDSALRYVQKNVKSDAWPTVL